MQDVRGVHLRFIEECFRRLNDLTEIDGTRGTSPARSSTGHIADPELSFQAIERLLLLAQRYISAVEVRTCANGHFLKL